MCNLLAESRDSEPAGTPPANLNLEHVIAIKPLLPLNNAFKLLVQPLPALGLGLRLKREFEICFLAGFGIWTDAKIVYLS